jgi:hypothetical protein
MVLVGAVLLPLELLDELLEHAASEAAISARATRLWCFKSSLRLGM